MQFPPPEHSPGPYNLNLNNNDKHSVTFPICIIDRIIYEIDMLMIKQGTLNSL